MFFVFIFTLLPYAGVFACFARSFEEITKTTPSYGRGPAVHGAGSSVQKNCRKVRQHAHGQACVEEDASCSSAQWRKRGSSVREVKRQERHHVLRWHSCQSRCAVRELSAARATQEIDTSLVGRPGAHSTSKGRDNVINKKGVGDGYRRGVQVPHTFVG